MKIKTEYVSVFIILSSTQLCVRTPKYIYRSGGLLYRNSFSSDFDTGKAFDLKRKYKNKVV
jgi:hypothetical protein